MLRSIVAVQGDSGHGRAVGNDLDGLDVLDIVRVVAGGAVGVGGLVLGLALEM